MSRLGKRVERLEGTKPRVAVIFMKAQCPSWEERQEYAERYRREHGLPPETVVHVVDEVDAEL